MQFFTFLSLIVFYKIFAKNEKKVKYVQNSCLKGEAFEMSQRKPHKNIKIFTI